MTLKDVYWSLVWFGWLAISYGIGLLNGAAAGWISAGVGTLFSVF